MTVINEVIDGKRLNVCQSCLSLSVCPSTRVEGPDLFGLALAHLVSISEPAVRFSRKPVV